MKRALIVVALAAAVSGGVFGYRQFSRARARGPAPGDADIRALTKERDTLRDELRVLLEQHNVLDFANAPPGNVLVGVPTILAGDLVGQMVGGLFSEVRLRLQNIQAHHQGDVKAKVVFTQKVGHFKLDVDVKDIRAVLKPGEPQLTFGGDRIGIRLPVTVADGRGTANVRFRWQGKGLAGAVCGDMDVSPDVSSQVKPAAYTVAGEFLLAAEGETLVAKPIFKDLLLKIVLQPTESTWATLSSTVEDVKEDKNGICRMAIRKVDVRSIVQKTIAKGFAVKLPGRLFKPISLPATVERSVTLQGRTLALDAHPLGLRVTPVMLWYGVGLGRESATP